MIGARINRICFFVLIGKMLKHSEVFMNRDQTQLQAAHDLGEAILRFIKAIDFPGMEVDRTHSGKTAELSPPVVSPTPLQSQNNENRLIRVGEAAEILSLGRSMIYQMMTNGKLPSVKIGGARRLRLSDVLKLIDE